MLASVVLPALFAATGSFALGALALTWRTYGGQIRAIRAQIAALDDQREFTVRLAITETREYLPVARRSTVRVPAVPQRRPRLAGRAAA
jgi:hypothetical protein